MTNFAADFHTEPAMSPTIHAPEDGAPLPHERLWNANFVKLNAANFLLFFSFYLLMPLLPIYLSEAFGAGKHTIGLVLSGYTLMALLVRPFSGYIVDSFPRKKVLLAVYGAFALLFGGYLLASSLLLFAVVRTLHGAPFGATTVANSTMAIDSLPSARRTEGIGYYGLSNNVATAVAPSVAVYLYATVHDFRLLFLFALASSVAGLCVNATVKARERQPLPDRRQVSLDRFFLVRGWSQSVVIAALSFSYGVLSTYLAIYGKEELGITGGTATYFMLLSLGLMLSRVVGGRSLRKGHILQNAGGGMALSVLGYLLFAAVRHPAGYYGSAVVIGLGNGHMYPAMQNMFINLAPNSQRGTANATILTSWDLGVGAGVLGGGAVAEAMGYGCAFWLATAVNVAGVAFFFLFSRRRYLRQRLR